MPIVRSDPSPGRGRVAAVVALLFLTGCSGSAVDQAKSPKPSGRATPAVSKPAAEAMAPAPKVGDCWSTTPELLGKVAWEGDAPVSCSQDHNAVTYRVGTLPAGLSYATIEQDRLTTRKVVTDSCNETRAHIYLGHRKFHPPLRVDDVFFAPSEKQWAAGARWFRCDLGFPEINSDFALRLDWQPLPANLRAAVHKDDRSFAICSNGSVKAGPIARYQRTGKCADGMNWVATDSVDIAKKPHEPYPGNKVLRRRALDACDSPLGHWVTWTLRDRWEDGNTRAFCWVRWRHG